jgi:hypothetical protein
MTTEAAETAAPVLVHEGTYALYETPDGGRHLVYRRLVSVDEDGQARAIDGAQDQHLPDFPPEALPFISHFLENGVPPQLLAMLSGKVNPLRLLAQLKGVSNGAG